MAAAAWRIGHGGGGLSRGTAECLGVRARGGHGGAETTWASRTRTRVRCGAGKRVLTGGALALERGSGERSGCAAGPGEKGWRAVRVRGRKERRKETQAQGAGARKKATRGKLGQNGEKAVHARGEGKREGRRGRPRAGLLGGEKRGGGGQLGWAQRREKREKNKTKSKRAFEFELKFELKFNPNKLQPMKQCKEHEMHNHMVFPIFIFILKKKIIYQKPMTPLTYHFI
jgi:hypothetical protein